MNIALKILIYLIFAFSAIFVTIILHELGHLICGLISGYKFSLFRFLFFTISKEDNKLRLKMSKNFLIIGQCLMMPPRDEGKFKFVLYNLGGGLFNLISGIIVLVVWIFARGNQWYISAALIVFVILSFYFTAVNLIPYIANGIPNDGMNIKQGRESADAKHGFYVMLLTSADIVSGARYRDIDPKILEVSDQADLGNYISAYPLLIASERLVDLGKYDESIATLNKLDAKKYPDYYKASMQMDNLYYYSAISTNKEVAKKLYANDYLKKILHSDLPSCPRILSAYEFFINGNHELAKKLLEYSKATLNNLPGKGHISMEKDRIKELEELMKADLTA